MDRDQFHWFANGFEWLEEHLSGWQFGEQGLLVKLAEGLEGTCMEIGAGDGTELPLTLEPFLAAGWKLNVYEADAQKREKLAEYLLQYKSFGIFGKFERHSAANMVSNPRVVVIDVDSCDGYIMDEILTYARPSILMVEHYDLAGPFVTGEQDFDKPVPRWLCGMPTKWGFIVQFHHAALDVIAIENGYAPVARTRVNSIYLKSDLYRRVKQDV
jgi:hypothetical protein